MTILLHKKLKGSASAVAPQSNRAKPQRNHVILK